MDPNSGQNSSNDLTWTPVKSAQLSAEPQIDLTVEGNIRIDRLVLSPAQLKKPLIAPHIILDRSACVGGFDYHSHEGARTFVFSADGWNSRDARAELFDFPRVDTAHSVQRLTQRPQTLPAADYYVGLRGAASFYYRTVFFRSFVAQLRSAEVQLYATPAGMLLFNAADESERAVSLRLLMTYDSMARLVHLSIVTTPAPASEDAPRGIARLFRKKTPPQSARGANILPSTATVSIATVLGILDRAHEDATGALTSESTSPLVFPRWPAYYFAERQDIWRAALTNAWRVHKLGSPPPPVTLAGCCDAAESLCSLVTHRVATITDRFFSLHVHRHNDNGNLMIFTGAFSNDVKQASIVFVQFEALGRDLLVSWDAYCRTDGQYSLSEQDRERFTRRQYLILINETQRAVDELTDGRLSSVVWPRSVTIPSRSRRLDEGG